MLYINGALTLYGAWQQEVLLEAEFLVGGMARLCCLFKHVLCLIILVVILLSVQLW